MNPLIVPGYQFVHMIRARHYVTLEVATVFGCGRLDTLPIAEIGKHLEWINDLALAFQFLVLRGI